MSRQPDGVRLGSVVGVVGGVVFVLVNAGPLPGAVALRVLAVTVALGIVAASFLRPAAGGGESSPTALRVYLLCVAAMVVAIPAGAAGLGAADQPDLVLPWVVLVVGLHFVPFAVAFGAPVFRWLGGAMALVGVIGGVAVLATDRDGTTVAATGVAAGTALLAAAAAPYVRGRTPSVRQVSRLPGA